MVFAEEWRAIAVPSVIGVGMGGAGRGASAPPLFKVGGPAICFGPPTFYLRTFCPERPF